MPDQDGLTRRQTLGVIGVAGAGAVLLLGTITLAVDPTASY